MVPADRKWFTRLVVAAAIHDGIERLKLAYPKVDDAKKADLRAARTALDGGSGKTPTRTKSKAKAKKPKEAEPESQA